MFKFLGLIYDPLTGGLKGATRKGSTLEMNAGAHGVAQFLEEHYRSRGDKLNTDAARIMNSGMNGWFISRFFNNS